jgi:hypothetical protein
MGDTVGRLPEAELALRSAYRVLNARDVDAALELMHPEVTAKGLDVGAQGGEVDLAACL